MPRGVEDCDRLLVPAECECSADREYDCRDKVALATIGGPVVLQTAVDCPTPSVDGEGTDSTTLVKRLGTDSSVTTGERHEDAPPSSVPNTSFRTTRSGVGGRVLIRSPAFLLLVLGKRVR